VTIQLAYDYLGKEQVRFTSATRDELFYVVVATRAATAAAFVVGLLRLRSARSAVIDVVSAIEGSAVAADGLGPALRRALGDDSLELVPWSAAAGGFVDPDGRRVVLPVTQAGRAATVIEDDGLPIAVLLHDEALLEDPGMVSAVMATVRLTADNERLRRELQAQLAEVAASRSRILAAGDAERRRIERDLHDGAQQRLVTVALSLTLVEGRLDDGGDPAVGEAVRQAVKDLAEAIAELRDLARGIHPAILTESGLTAALGALADRCPIPVRLEIRVLSEPEETTAAAAYFVVAEALTNVVKHARAAEVRIDVSRSGGRLSLRVADDGIGGADPAAGSGLRGLFDRVEAAGGSASVTSAPGAGTTVQVLLPCE
jgi:signal transduction histidine kinase